MKNQTIFVRIQAALLPVLLFMLILAPGHVEAQTTIASSGQSRHIIEENNQSLKVEYEGKIVIAPDDRSIQDISDGGYIRIEKTTFGNTRELFISNRGNSLNYEYKEGGRTKPFEPAGKAWLADILPDLMRGTTIGAESRVDRLYNTGGAEEVLKELPALKSDHVRAKYAELLLGKNVKEREIPMVIDAIGEHIRSDHYRYEIFKSNYQLLLAKPGNQENYLKAVQTVGSDHYKTQLVKLVVKNQLPAGQQQQLLQLIGTINSDHYRTEILKELAGNKLSDDELGFLLGNLVPEMKSDHYRTEVIGKVLESQSSLSSKNIDALIKSIGKFGSDHYRKEALEKMVQLHKLSAQNYEALFAMLSGFSSDHYKAEFMKRLFRDNTVFEHFELFIREASRIKSDHYRAEVLKAVLKNDNLSEDQLVSLIRSADSFKSDHYKAEFLKQACSAHTAEKVKSAVREIAKTINSSHAYGEVMRCAS